MPLYIKDNETANLVTELAERLRTTKQDAIKSAVKAELQRLSPTPSLHETVRELRARHPLPVPTGKPADKAFFDKLSGEVD